jgi:hypothetical protein
MRLSKDDLVHSLDRVPASKPQSPLPVHFLTMPQTPLATSSFTVQELVDNCVDFLHDSPRDLRACALVCRSWVHASQLHLFSSISIGSFGVCTNSALCHSRYTRLFQVLCSSPHLLRHVRSLEIFLNCIPITTIVLIATLPLTNLRRIKVAGRCTPASVSVIQELFTLPTLREIAIWGDFSALDDFMRMLAHCSPSIQALYFRHVRVKAGPRQPFLQAAAKGDAKDEHRIKISTLSLVDAEQIHGWLEDMQSKFDFSDVRRLLVHATQTLPRWRSMSQIEHLQFEIPWVWILPHSMIY